jgi:hypothetical protein
MQPITATASLTQESNTVAPPAPPYTYFGVAESLMPGVKPLVDALPSGSSAALALVCAHTLECLLKAYISRDGSKKAACKARGMRHDLKALWKEASKQGLGVPASPPDWADRLSSLHHQPYLLRYSEGIHGIVLPAAAPMAPELTTLLEVVRKHIKN